MRWERKHAAIAVAVMVVACTGPGGGAGSSQPKPTTAANTPSSAPRQDARPIALAAYRQMWAARDTALRNPRSDDPRLSRYATGAALWTLLAEQQAAQNQGLRGTGSVRTNPVVTTATPPDRPTRISIRDCIDTSQSKLARVTPGRPYQNIGGGLRLCQADVQKQIDGSWKVLTFSMAPPGSCV